MVYWDEGVVWLWCEWEKDWRRGCGKIRGDNSRCVKGEEGGVGGARPGSKGLRGGQKNVLDLSMSDVVANMGEMGDGGDRTKCEDPC